MAPKPWTKEQLDILKAEYPTCYDTKNLARRLGVTMSAMGAMAQRIGLNRQFRAGSKSGDKRVIDYIAKYYTTKCDDEIANALGITKAVVRYVARKQHLVKPKEIYQRARFRKGQIPFNRGIKRSEWMSEEGIKIAEKTHFRVGQAPVNHVDIGHERLNGEKYVEVKVAEPDVYKLKHRKMWEDAYGKIPSGYVVSFKDNDRYHIELSNLVLKSQKEVMLENGISNYPKELRQAISRLKNINQMIKKYGKQEN